MDLCSGMDSQSAELAAVALDNDIASEGDDEAGPQVKKKRINKPKRTSSSMKSAAMQDTVGGLKTVREECEGEEESEEGEEGNNRALTERVKERLFAALCRDMLKLGDCKGTDKLVVKEYIKLCSSLCDCGWLSAENVKIFHLNSYVSKSKFFGFRVKRCERYCSPSVQPLLWTKRHKSYWTVCSSLVTKWVFVPSLRMSESLPSKL